MKLLQLTDVSGLDAETVCDGKGKGNRCPLLTPVAAVIKGVASSGGSRAEVVVTEGWNSVHRARREPRKYSIEEAVACTNAALAVTAEDLP
jgi:hypothetical protein